MHKLIERLKYPSYAMKSGYILRCSFRELFGSVQEAKSAMVFV